TLARMPAAHDEFLSRARLLGLRKAGNLELRVLALVYHSDWNLLLLDCLPDKVVKLIRHLGDEHLRAFRNNHGLFRSGVRLLNFRCARCLRHWLLANRQRNKDQNKNAAQQYFFHSFLLAPDYSVIFFLMCFAQASPALCLPRTEFVLFTEYAKMTEPVLRFTILMLAVSLVCCDPRKSIFAHPALSVSATPVLSYSAFSLVATTTTGTFFCCSPATM